MRVLAHTPATGLQLGCNPVAEVAAGSPAHVGFWAVSGTALLISAPTVLLARKVFGVQRAAS